MTPEEREIKLLLNLPCRCLRRGTWDTGRCCNPDYPDYIQKEEHSCNCWCHPEFVVRNEPWFDWGEVERAAGPVDPF